MNHQFPSSIVQCCSVSISGPTHFRGREDISSSWYFSAAASLRVTTYNPSGQLAGYPVIPNAPKKITADTTRRRHQWQQQSVDPYFWPQWNELSSQPCPRSKQRDMYISVYIQRLNFCVQRPIDSTWGRNFQPAAFRVGPYTRDNFLLTNVRCNSVKFPYAEAFNAKSTRVVSRR